MATAAVDAGEAPKKKRSKKLVIIIIAIVAVLAIAGAAAFFLLKKKAPAEGEDGEEVAEAAHEPAKKDHKNPPAFLPLDPFVVNLADRESERYAQIGITLQVDDAHAAEELKAYMPAIRNGVLMVLANKTSAQLLDRAGKEKLAAEIMREAVKPLGIEIEDDSAAADEHGDEGKPAKKKKVKAAAVHNPVEHVHFSSFIIQ